MTKWYILTALAGVLVTGPMAHAQDDPFHVTADLASAPEDGARQVTVHFTVPSNHYLYADQVVIKASGVDWTPVNTPQPEQHYDTVLEKEVAVYEEDMSFAYTVTAGASEPIDVQVAYQGCSKKPMVCFLPASRTFALTASDASPAPESAMTNGTNGVRRSVGADGTDWRQLADEYTIARSAVGYLEPDDFLAFLNGDDAAGSNTGSTGPLDDVLQTRGVFFLLIAILLGGLALNLTPCVLPMIPINIAIIGAGAQAGSRLRGFLLGAAYGGGIAVVYGALGVTVALTGARFGQLNASPVFNLAIAALFIVMALAMFGVINIDLSRFQKGSAGGDREKRGGFLTAAGFGAVAALLAGACVAPVVIAVLLLAADLQAGGNVAGLLLPFVLGIGMALPWPFAGAGLSFLPRPGKWMSKVKVGFGIVILLFALWYARVGVSLTMHRAPATSDALTTGLQQGLEADKPVLLDFWATWCKNCTHMDKTTLKHPDVTARLENVVFVKYQAENPSGPTVAAVLDYFGVSGFPTYVILEPNG